MLGSCISCWEMTISAWGDGYGRWEQVQKVVAGRVLSIVTRAQHKRDVGTGGHYAREGVARANRHLRNIAARCESGWGHLELYVYGLVQSICVLYGGAWWYFCK